MKGKVGDQDTVGQDCMMIWERMRENIITVKEKPSTNTPLVLLEASQEKPFCKSLPLVVQDGFDGRMLS